MLQRAADYRPFGIPVFVAVLHSSILLFRRKARPRRIMRTFSKSSRTREEGPEPGPDISCAHANYSSTMQPCVHMVVLHYPHDISPPSRKQAHIARAFAFTQPAYRTFLFSKNQPVASATPSCDPYDPRARHRNIDTRVTLRLKPFTNLFNSNSRLIIPSDQTNASKDATLQFLIDVFTLVKVPV